MIEAVGVPQALAMAGDSQQIRRSWRAYTALALSTVLFVFAIWYQVYVDTRKDAQSWSDALLQSHRQWRLRTTFVFLVWSILAGFCVPFGFGVVVFVPLWLWFVYRITKGMILFARQRVI